MTASVPRGPVGGGPLDSTMSSETQPDIPVDRLANVIGTPSPSSEDVASVASQLCASITGQKSALHMCMGDHSDVVSKHLSQANDLHDTVGDVNTRLSDMSQEFDAINPRAFPAVGRFVDQSSALSSCTHDQAVAAATLNALDALKTKYNDLVVLEDILWDGKGADHDVLLDIVSGKHTTAPSSSQVASAIDNRQKILLSMLSEQITSAWVKSITVASQPSEPPHLSVKRKLKLALPHVSRVTKPSHSLPSTGPPSFTSAELIHSLDVLGLLSPRLQEIQSQLVHKVICPFIDNANWQPVVESSGDVASLQMSVVGRQSPAETIHGVETILSFIATSVCPPPVITSPSLQARNNFLLAIQREAFERVLSDIIMPAMPLASGDLSVWLQVVHQAAASEEELQPPGATTAVLRQFVNQEAGGRWLSKRRQALLRKARRFIYNDWKSSGFRQVDVAAPTTEEATATHVEPETAVTVADKVLDDELEADDDGWGFDDKPSEEPKTAEGNPEDDSSGWDFDDVAPPIAPPVVNPKPTRVAKRLGKRAKQSESVDLPQSLPSTPPREEEPLLQPRAVVTPSPPTPQRHWRRVSLVCDEVVTMANDAAAEMYAVPSLSINDASFSSLESGMSDQLAEVLDFIRATAPVANVEYAKTPAVALQLSNDFAYIGDTLQGSPAVCSNDLAQHFKSAGNTIYQSFVENQLTVVTSILSGAHHFVDTSNETVFAPAQQAIDRLVVYVKELAVDLDSLFDSQRRDILLGGIVEAMVVSVLGDILTLEDITEAESEKIGLLVGELESLDSQFVSDSDVSAIATFVPHWLKLCYTNEILRANLVDITYLFENGSLVDFTPQELDRLVRALFADSQKRTVLLEKIGS